MKTPGLFIHQTLPTAGLRCELQRPAPRWRHSSQINTQLSNKINKRYAEIPKTRRKHPRRTCCSIVESVAIDGPVRDVLAFSVSILGSRLVVRIFDALETSGALDKKLSRKLVHTLAGPLFLVCWPLYSSAEYAQYLAALVPSLNIVRLLLAGLQVVDDRRAVSAMSRTGDPAELLRGPLYYVVVLCAVTAIYWRQSTVGIVITSLMCGGDGLADIVGRNWGKSNPLPWNPSKSWAGSAAMFGGGLVMALALIQYFSYFGYIDVEFLPTMAAVALISFVAAVIESLPINQILDDNLSVPGVAALMGVALLQFLIEVVICAVLHLSMSQWFFIKRNTL